MMKTTIAKEKKVIKNAVIEDASLSSRDHGLLSSYVMLDYGGVTQGFGGYCLYLPKSFTHHTLQSVAGHWIWSVMEVAEVSDWSKLKGRTVRVETDGKRGKIIAIGHIVKDIWFRPEQEFEGAAK